MLAKNEEAVAHLLNDVIEFARGRLPEPAFAVIEPFLRHYYAFVYVRIMQALGAYGFRGFYERKAHFLQSVPYALKNLRWLLHNVELPIALPTLIAAFHITKIEEAASTAGAPENRTNDPRTSAARAAGTDRRMNPPPAVRGRMGTNGA